MGLALRAQRFLPPRSCSGIAGLAIVAVIVGLAESVMETRLRLARVPLVAASSSPWLRLVLVMR